MATHAVAPQGLACGAIHADKQALRSSRQTGFSRELAPVPVVSRKQIYRVGDSQKAGASTKCSSKANDGFESVERKASKHLTRRSALAGVLSGLAAGLLVAGGAKAEEVDPIEERLLASATLADANEVAFGFDGLGGEPDEYASGELVAVAQAGEGAVLFLEVDGYEEPMKLGIGPVEAMAVVTAAQGKHGRRPVTHEAWITSLKAVGWKVERVMIPRLVHNVFYGRVVLSHPSEARAALVGGQQQPEVPKLTSIDLRPSDAIALGMRCHAPLFVARSVVDEITFEDQLAKALMGSALGKQSQVKAEKPAVTLEMMEAEHKEA